jgi:hypothetical protein
VSDEVVIGITATVIFLVFSMVYCELRWKRVGPGDFRHRDCKLCGITEGKVAWDLCDPDICHPFFSCELRLEDPGNGT